MKSKSPSSNAPSDPVGAPRRVVINRHAEAVSAGMAPHIRVAVIFKRDDNWTLGAPAELEDVAFNTWPDRWQWFARAPDTHWRPIAEYVNGTQQFGRVDPT